MLTKWEKETIINFNYEDKVAYIFTYDKRWQRHLEKKLGVKPDSTNQFDGNWYTIPKKWVRLPQKPRQVSKETKERLAKTLEANRGQKVLDITNKNKNKRGKK